MRKCLKEIRESKGMHHNDVADRAGISRPYYTRIENGQHQVPIKTAKKIAKVLDFDWPLFYDQPAEKTG
ncbi:hypothetical protein SDC9_100302 [bioreactor metagenome]|uniref:HTH cro/C1-type domain-containing protein n=1 Tax=bioreactor metagenome TaxID=1076179 RepID=A0A645AVF8_9ZZZZ